LFKEYYDFKCIYRGLGLGLGHGGPHD
jgi:hypothetical protein